MYKAGIIWKIRTLTSDGATAFKNALYEHDPGALWLNCYTHSSNNNSKKLPKITDQLHTKILRDIEFLQLMYSKDFFDLASKLFIEKYEKSKIKEVEKFLEYFQKNKLQKDSNWYEGAALFAPSTNNAIESMNSNLKTNYLEGHQLPLFRFLLKCKQVIKDQIEIVVRMKPKYGYLIKETPVYPIKDLRLSNLKTIYYFKFNKESKVPHDINISEMLTMIDCD